MQKLPGSPFALRRVRRGNTPSEGDAPAGGAEFTELAHQTEDRSDLSGGGGGSDDQGGSAGGDDFHRVGSIRVNFSERQGKLGGTELCRIASDFLQHRNIAHLSRLVNTFGRLFSAIHKNVNILPGRKAARGEVARQPQLVAKIFRGGNVIVSDAPRITPTNHGAPTLRPRLYASSERIRGSHSPRNDCILHCFVYTVR